MTATLLRQGNARILSQFRDKGAKFAEFPTSNASDDEGLRVNVAFASRVSLRRWSASPGCLLKVTQSDESQRRRQHMVVQVWLEESYWTMTKTASSDANSAQPELFVADVDALRSRIKLDAQVCSREPSKPVHRKKTTTIRINDCFGCARVRVRLLLNCCESGC